MHFQTPTIVALAMLSATTNALPTLPLVRRANQVRCYPGGGNTNDSNNNARFLQGFGNQAITVGKGGTYRVVARTGSTVCEIANSGGPDTPQQSLTGNQIAEALLKINYLCGQTGVVGGAVQSDYNAIVQISAGLG